jgi:YesN/AraC family two-component response regulator
METLIRKLKVLYVEDDRIHREELSDYLSRRVGRLYLAENGEQGLEKFEALNPDLVITDLRMPKMSGIELAQNIRKVNKTVPIIVLTALSDKDTILETVKIGILDYVLKPVDVKELLQVITKAVSTITAIDQEFGYQPVAPEQLNTLKSALTSYLKKETGKGPIDIRFISTEEELELTVMGTLTRFELALMSRAENQKLVEYNRSIFFKDRAQAIEDIIAAAFERDAYRFADVEVDAVKDKSVLTFKM